MSACSMMAFEERNSVIFDNVFLFLQCLQHKKKKLVKVMELPHMDIEFLDDTLLFYPVDF